MALVYSFCRWDDITHWESGLIIGMTDNLNLWEKNDLNVFHFFLCFSADWLDGQTKFVNRICPKTLRGKTASEICFAIFTDFTDELDSQKGGTALSGLWNRPISIRVDIGLNVLTIDDEHQTINGRKDCYSKEDQIFSFSHFHRWTG